MRQYMYNNRGVIMWATLFTTIVLVAQLILKFNSKLTLEIYGLGEYDFKYPPIWPFQAIISILHCYNVFFQRNGVKEKVFDNDDILDT